MRPSSGAVWILPAGVLAAGPSLAFLAAAAPELIFGPARPPASTARLSGLLIHTAGLALLTGLLAGVLGAGAALWLATRGPTARALGLALLPLPLLLPRPVPALAAATLLGSAAPVGGAGALLASAAVLAAAWFPAVALAVLLDLAALAAAPVEAGLLTGGPAVTWGRGILPATLPAAAAASAFVACAAATNHSVPATFQFRVWATELYAEFALGSGAGRVAALAVPLLLLAPLALIAVARGVRILTGTATPGGLPRLPAPPAALRAALLLAAAIALAVPPAVILILAAGARSPRLVAGAFHTGAPSILASASLAAAAAALATAAALPVALRLLRRPSPGLLALCLLPAVLPAPVHGIGAITLYHALPGPARLTAALAGRALPFALVVLLVVLRRRAGDPLDAAVLVRGFTRRLRLLLRTAAPALTAGAAVAASMGFGELGVTVLLAPPGADPFSVKLFNLLHYGAGDAAAALALAALPLPLLVWGAAVAAAGRAR